MNKRFLSAVLFGALMVSSTGTFVSCKDYDDDIDQINKELTDIKSAIADLKTKVEGGKYVTNVAKEGDGIKITWNDNSTSTIETIKGDKGDKTLVTIVDGYWAFDGVKSEYPAKGDKGDKGENGEAAAAGHDAKISSDGYWMVWDAEAKDYKKTEYIAGGATAVAGEHGWTIIVRDKDGQEQSIYIPNSADLVSIAPALGELNENCDFTIYYGLLTSDVEWTGAKGKMGKGMYPTLDRDVQMMLNPTGVDGTAYKFEFKGSDDKELWGLSLKDAKAYEGEKLTRAASASGVWTLPRDIDHVASAELAERADYVTQFKKNDNQYYAFALSATSVEDPSKVIKSQYLYTLKPVNVGDIKASGFSNVNLDKDYYVWNQNHKPNFDGWTYQQGATGILGLNLSQVIYDYKLEIDKTEMPDAEINKYGLQISEDGYTFNATKEAAVDNWVDLKITYILVNGSQTTVPFSVRIVAKDIVDVNSNIGSINEKFNANLIKAADAPFSKLANKYVFAKEVSFSLADKLGSNYDEWVDAMYNGLKYKANDDKAEFLKVASAMTGGDPINNTAEHNAALMENFIYFDYVDADGKSCVYDVADNKLIESIKNIKALKVYFIAGTYSDGTIVNNTPVKAPYYTVNGNAWTGNGYALPLSNAFRVQLAVAKEQQTVAGFDFTFQLTMPDNSPIKRETVGNQTSKWNDDQDFLTIYGQKYNDQVNVDMRDAFVGAFALKSPSEDPEYFDYDYAYGPMKPEAAWYNITWPTVANVDNATLIGVNLIARMPHTVTLGDIENTAEYGLWNSWGHIARVFNMNGLKASEDRPTYTTEAVEYHHFGVYRESLSNFTLKFASKVEDSQKATLKTNATGVKNGLIEAKAKYAANGVDVEYYTFSVSNASFEMTDAFNNAYYLFDDASVSRGSKHIKLNEATQGIFTAMNGANRDIDGIKATMFGLYPEVRQAEHLVYSALNNATSGTPITVDLVQSTTNANFFTGMTFKIPGGEGQYANDKKFEITFNVKDVFGTFKSFTFYARTVNEAIGNDNKPVGE